LHGFELRKRHRTITEYDGADRFPGACGPRGDLVIAGRRWLEGASTGSAVAGSVVVGRTSQSSV
ncbi:MAG: hypothetical protein JRE19_14720, partial [Deltaproteobacteria bacterium]|nr:hypothetical protein [Deltaproteobacteria bacterium]